METYMPALSARVILIGRHSDECRPGRMVDTSDDWITSRTGIKQRRKAGPGEYTSQFAVQLLAKP